METVKRYAVQLLLVLAGILGFLQLYIYTFSFEYAENGGQYPTLWGHLRILGLSLLCSAILCLIIKLLTAKEKQYDVFLKLLLHSSIGLALHFFCLYVIARERISYLLLCQILQSVIYLIPMAVLFRSIRGRLMRK